MAMAIATAAFLTGYGGALAVGVSGGGWPPDAVRRRVESDRHPLLNHDLAPHLIAHTVEASILEQGKCGINALLRGLAGTLGDTMKDARTWDEAAKLLYAKREKHGEEVGPRKKQFVFTAFDPLRLGSFLREGGGLGNPYGGVAGPFGPPADVRATWVAMCRKAHVLWRLVHKDQRLNVAVREVPYAMMASARVDDADVMMAAVALYGGALRYASPAMKARRDIVMAAVAQDGLALEHASEAMQDKRDIVTAAVTENGGALEYASEARREERDIVTAAVEENGSALEYASIDMKNDPGVVTAAVEENGLALRHASNDMKNERYIVMAAVAQRGSALQYASAAMKNDPDVVMEAAAQNGDALPHASPAMKNVCAAMVADRRHRGALYARYFDPNVDLHISDSDDDLDMSDSDD